MADTEIVKIVVGPNAKVFNVHKGIICARSPYFRDAFEGNFREAKEGAAMLSTVDPSVFGVFLDWVYYNRLQYRKEPGKVPTEIDHCEHADAIDLEVYIFADQHDTPLLRQLSLESMHARYSNGRVPRDSIVVRAFEGLPASSPMWQFLIDLYGNRCTIPIQQEQITEPTLPYDFMFRVMNMMFVKRAPVWKQLAPPICDSDQYRTKKQIKMGIFARSCYDGPSSEAD